MTDIPSIASAREGLLKVSTASTEAARGSNASGVPTSRPGFSPTLSDESFGSRWVNCWKVLSRHSFTSLTVCLLRVISYFAIVPGLILDRLVFLKYARRIEERSFVPAPMRKHFSADCKAVTATAEEDFNNLGSPYDEDLNRIGEAVDGGSGVAKSTISVAIKGGNAAEIPRENLVIFSGTTCMKNKAALTACFSTNPGKAELSELASKYPEASPARLKALAATRRVDWENLTFRFPSPNAGAAKDFQFHRQQSFWEGVANKQEEEALVFLSQMIGTARMTESDSAEAYAVALKIFIKDFCTYDPETPAGAQQLKEGLREFVRIAHRLPRAEESDLENPVPANEDQIAKLVQIYREPLRELALEARDRSFRKSYDPTETRFDRPKPTDFDLYIAQKIKPFLHRVEVQERLELYREPVLEFLKRCTQEPGDKELIAQELKTFVRKMHGESLEPREAERLCDAYRPHLERLLDKLPNLERSTAGAYEWRLNQFAADVHSLNLGAEKNLNGYRRPGAVQEEAMPPTDKELESICKLLTPEARAIPFRKPPGIELEPGAEVIIEIAKPRRLPGAPILEFKFSTSGEVRAFWNANPEGFPRYSRMELLPSSSGTVFQACLRHTISRGTFDGGEITQINDARFLTRFTG